MSVLGRLGIDFKLLIAQIINFGLLLWLLAKFLYKPIVRRIEKDEKELKKAREQNKELEQQKILFERQKKEEIIEAKKKAKKIIREAESIAKGIRDRILKEAKEEKVAVIKQIKSRLLEIENAKKSKK